MNWIDLMEKIILSVIVVLGLVLVVIIMIKLIILVLYSNLLK